MLHAHRWQPCLGALKREHEGQGVTDAGVLDDRLAYSSKYRSRGRLSIVQEGVAPAPSLGLALLLVLLALALQLLLAGVLRTA